MDFILKHDDCLVECKYKVFYKPILIALNSKKPNVRKTAVSLLKKVTHIKGPKKFEKIANDKFKPSIAKKLKALIDKHCKKSEEK